MKTNPLNIRASHELFLGEIKSKSSFKVFVNRTYGVRAAIKIISNYILKFGKPTVADVINRWAPPTENNTKNYIQFVCQHTLLQPDSIINTKDKFLRVIHAMAIMESNINLTNKCLLDAWSMVFDDNHSFDSLLK